MCGTTASFTSADYYTPQIPPHLTGSKPKSSSLHNPESHKLYSCEPDGVRLLATGGFVKHQIRALPATLAKA
jgi:hypothetical protein